jgi:hypothetical protein
MEAAMNARLTQTAGAVEALDPIWTTLRSEAEDVVQREPALAGSFTLTC